MANNVQELNYEEILTLIQGQLMEHMNSEEYFAKYKGTKIILSKEQQFMKQKDKDPNAIYIVVRFGAADVMFRQTVLPATIVVLTQQNKVDLAYDLMYEYSQRFTLVRANNDTIQQVYESPSMSGNFNEVYEGFRSVVTMTAAFVIGKNSNEYKVYYYYSQDGVQLAEEIPMVSTTFSFVGSPDTQAFYNKNNFVESVVSFGAVSLGFTTFVLSDSKLINDVLDILGETDNAATSLVYDGGADLRVIDSDESDINTVINSTLTGNFDAKSIEILNKSNGNIWVFDKEVRQKNEDGSYVKDENGAPVYMNTWKFDRTLEKSVVSESNFNNSNVNKTFKLGVVYKDGKHARIKNYKLTQASGTQDVGQIPKITLAFTE